MRENQPEMGISLIKSSSFIVVSGFAKKNHKNLSKAKSSPLLLQLIDNKSVFSRF